MPRQPYIKPRKVYIKTEKETAEEEKGSNNGLFKTYARINRKRIRVIVNIGANISLISKAFIIRYLKE